jgi:hypothetical protein
VALQALGRQLDRRERILDLVRKPPGHLPPRRHLLRPDERRHVVEHEHRAFEPGRPVQARRRHGEGHFAALAGDAHLLRHRLRAGPGGIVEHGGHGREVGAEHLGDRPPFDSGRQREQPRRRRIDAADASGRVDRDDAGGNPLENRLHRTVTALDGFVPLLEIERRPFGRRWRAEVRGHRVERLDHVAAVVGPVLDAVLAGRRRFRAPPPTASAPAA